MVNHRHMEAVFFIVIQMDTAKNKQKTEEMHYYYSIKGEKMKARIVCVFALANERKKDTRVIRHF